MKVINDHIKSNEYKNVYLLYGEESYLRKQYKDKLKNAIVGDDTINYSYFQDDKIQVKEIIETGDTLPFFAEHRLIIVENSGFFKSSNEELADYIKNIPEYLIIVFVEEEIDKRNKLFKAVNDVGYVTEMKPQTTATLEKWIFGLCREEGKEIDRDAISLLLEKTGASMELVRQELNKLFGYCLNKNSITVNDVELICTTQTVSKIFDMISAIAAKQQQKALELYYDLLSLREPPMRILYLIVRQFNGILQVKEGLNHGMTNGEIAGNMGVAPFIVGKYVSQSRNFSAQEIISALKDCEKSEEAVKNGLLNDKMAVELMIIKYSSK